MYHQKKINHTPQYSRPHDDKSDEENERNTEQDEWEDLPLSQIPSELLETVDLQQIEQQEAGFKKLWDYLTTDGSPDFRNRFVTENEFTSQDDKILGQVSLSTANKPIKGSMKNIECQQQVEPVAHFSKNPPGSFRKCFGKNLVREKGKSSTKTSMGKSNESDIEFVPESPEVISSNEIERSGSMDEREHRNCTDEDFSGQAVLLPRKRSNDGKNLALMTNASRKCKSADLSQDIIFMSSSEEPNSRNTGSVNDENISKFCQNGDRKKKNGYTNSSENEGSSVSGGWRSQASGEHSGLSSEEKENSDDLRVPNSSKRPRILRHRRTTTKDVRTPQTVVGIGRSMNGPAVAFIKHHNTEVNFQLHKERMFVAGSILKYLNISGFSKKELIKFHRDDLQELKNMKN